MVFPQEDHILFYNNAARSNESNAGLLFAPWGGGIGRGGRGERKGVSQSHHWSWNFTGDFCQNSWFSYLVVGRICTFRPACLYLWIVLCLTWCPLYTWGPPGWSSGCFTRVTGTRGDLVGVMKDRLAELAAVSVWNLNAEMDLNIRGTRFIFCPYRGHKWRRMTPSHWTVPMASWRASSEGCASYVAYTFTGLCVCVCLSVNANDELVFDRWKRFVVSLTRYLTKLMKWRKSTVRSFLHPTQTTVSACVGECVGLFVEITLPADDVLTFQLFIFLISWSLYPCQGHGEPAGADPSCIWAKAGFPPERVVIHRRALCEHGTLLKGVSLYIHNILFCSSYSAKHPL